MASVLDLVKHYQHNIEKYPQDEQKVLRAIDKLFHLDVKVQHLQETGVGRTVNALRKEPGHVGQAARALVYKWKCMVAAEESDQEDDHNNTTSHNGSRRDSDDGNKQQERYENSTSQHQESNEQKYVNGDCKTSKRRHHSSEEEEPEHKKSKHSSSSEGESRKRKHEQVKKEISDSESDRSMESEDTASESEMSDEELPDNKPQIKIKTEPVDIYTTHEKHLSSSYSEVKLKREPSESKSQEPSKILSKHSSENKYSEKSKERSHSSHHEKSSKDKQKSNSEHKHKSEHKSSDKNKEKCHKKSKSSEKEKHKSSSNKTDSEQEKQDSSSHKSKSSSEKHKSSSHKSESASEKHKSHDKTKSEKKRSSSSHRSEKDKQKSSSEKESTGEKKLKQGSSSKEEGSSRKDKSNESCSSGSKEKSSSHKSDKKHSSSKDKSRSDSKSKEKKDDKSSERSSHKSSSSSHKSKSSSSKSSDEKPKKHLAQSEDSDDGGGIDCGSGASFAEVLGMIDPGKTSKKKSTPVKDTSSPSNYFNNDLSPASLLAPTAKLAPLPAIEISALPEISPNYRPRPPPKFLPHFTDEEAISAGISSKNQRTKVYSGNKTYGKIPTLYEMCVQILQEHIDALEYTGGVPYDILKPVVDKATPQQLFMLEHYNPYLMEDTDHLWQKFCEKHFRTKKRQEMETWREMYMRCQEEQEHKLKSLTANIKMTQEAKKAPIKQTKMAYVDTVVKPPRNIARKQALHGTKYAAVASPAARVAALAKTATNVLRPGVPRPPAAPVQSPAALNKPKKAPLMQKALQFMRGRKR